MARILGRLAKALAERTHPVWLKNALIRLFCSVYDINHKDMASPAPHGYASFNDFFTRKLRASARRVAAGNNVLVCPADGTLSTISNHRTGMLMQAKNSYYTISELLGNKEIASVYEKGSHAVVYLAPKDYHRVHMPLEGTLLNCDYIPGSLFAVNRTATRMVPRLFTRNERLICHFNCGSYHIAIVFVAAFLVGGIGTIWERDISELSKLQKLKQQLEQQRASLPMKYHLKKGAELGHFRFGSTVVLLCSKPMSPIEHAEGSPCLMGEALGRIQN
jgi:phosphatidylserine decarboxylase